MGILWGRRCDGHDDDAGVGDESDKRISRVK